MDDFARRLLRWYRRAGRHDLPWKRDPRPYPVWISEIMLQQTQVATVEPYFNRFMQRFPDVRRLARAPLDEVLELWSGLGYYARARNLHRTARRITEEHGGHVPTDLDALTALPGIGRSTAGAILALSRNRPHAILDGNVKRVLARYHGVPGWPGEKKVERRLWRLAESHVPPRTAADYTQAIMDLGATVCTRTAPGCVSCPVHRDCRAAHRGIQDRLPAPRPVRERPVRRTVMAIMENDKGQILLERRPPAGVWGGLWSLPECPPGVGVEEWIRNEYGWSVRHLEPCPGVRHEFTHFSMHIAPVRVGVRVPHAVRNSAEQVWLKPGGEIAYGMATPIKRLIDDTYGGRQRRNQ